MLPQPVLAANAPGIITGVTPAKPQTAASIPAPTIITTLPVITSANSTSSPINEVAIMAHEVILPPPPPPESNIIANSKEEEDAKKAEEELLQEPQTLQQIENMVIKGNNARHMVMQKLMRKSEVLIFYI